MTTTISPGSNPLQAVLQHSIITRFKTGNEFIDLLIPYLLLSLIAFLGTKISVTTSIFEKLCRKIHHKYLEYA